MPQITLNSTQVKSFAAFIIKHNLKTFFLAKDEGAYIGATGGDRNKGTFENILFYFKGMDPSIEKFPGEAYDNARYAFGGDDFGEQLDASYILKMAERHEPKVTIKVTETSIKMDGTYKKLPAAAPAAAPAKKVEAAPAKKAAAPADVKNMTKGERIRQLLAEGVDINTIVGMVETTANSVRWHKSKMKAAA